MNKVTKHILELVAEFEKDGLKRPAEINRGFCDTFAKKVCEKVPDAKWKWGAKQKHAYIIYKGRYYDCESPYGEKTPSNLRFYFRENMAKLAGQRQHWDD